MWRRSKNCELNVYKYMHSIIIIKISWLKKLNILSLAFLLQNTIFYWCFENTGKRRNMRAKMALDRSPDFLRLLWPIFFFFFGRFQRRIYKNFIDRSKFCEPILKRVTQGTFLWNYFKIWPAVSEKKIFKEFFHVPIVQEAPIHQRHVYERIKISRTIF